VEVFERRRQEPMDSMTNETAALSGWVDFNVDASIGVAKDIAGRVVSIAGTIPESMEEGSLAPYRYWYRYLTLGKNGDS